MVAYRLKRFIGVICKPSIPLPDDSLDGLSGSGCILGLTAYLGPVRRDTIIAMAAPNIAAKAWNGILLRTSFSSAIANVIPVIASITAMICHVCLR